MLLKYYNQQLDWNWTAKTSEKIWKLTTWPHQTQRDFWRLQNVFKSDTAPKHMRRASGLHWSGAAPNEGTEIPKASDMFSCVPTMV